MKKVSILFAALLFAAPAFGQGSLYYSWSNCAGDANAASTVNFDCVNFEPAASFATFQLTAGAVDVVALSAVIDIQVEGVTSLPDFWRYDAAGCNASGLGISDVRGSGLCTTLGNAAFPGNSGTATDAFVTAYGVAFGGNDRRARMLTSVVRASSNPVTLAAGTRYFGFRLDWFMDNVGSCTGCTTVAGMTLNSILLENTSAQAGGDGVAAVVLSSDPSSSPNVCSNNATCGTVPVRSRTWGSIKSLYR